MRGSWLLLLSVVAGVSCTPRNVSSPLITERTSRYIESLIKEYNSTGLAVAVVQKLAPTANSSIPNWKIEYGSYGLARTSSSQDLVTPDTLFSIGSNSKLFLSISVGLILSNATLAASFQNRTGKKLSWWTRMKDLMPGEWVIQDKDIEQGATIQDLLSHRTGLPLHDLSWTGATNDTREVITNLRHLRVSATFRQTFQYNNLMYETLSYLPTLFLNQTYESYIQQHLFNPLNMTSTTFSVKRAEGEFGHRLAEGHLQHLRDATRGEKGWIKPTVPYYLRPGEEKLLAGAGGIISSARDISTWMAMLLNDGRHPNTNEVVVPADVLDFVSTGLVATQGKPEFPETSVKVYGAGVWRYSYQGQDIIEHGGNLPGFVAQVARFTGSPASLNVGESPATKNHGLGIITLSNDGERGQLMTEAPKFRIVEDILGLREVDWASRYDSILKEYYDWLGKNWTPSPEHPTPPAADFESLGRKQFNHPAYGPLVPCLVPQSMQQSPLLAMPTFENPYTNCTHVLSSPIVETCARKLASRSANVHYTVGQILLQSPTPYTLRWKRLQQLRHVVQCRRQTRRGPLADVGGGRRGRHLDWSGPKL
ncbi:beta-lactamase/transpeptidase-like protein [Coprinopsis sp. MPI-PUGE-AT-0042]|nr:beta-lactamase/transpeptidase-like protein [Coprinopsis sp. MPI-PUGE-AT-0042]